MTINQKFTTVVHAPRNKFNLSVIEYCVADLIDFACNYYKAPVKGWCSYSKPEMARFAGVSRRTIFTIVDKLEEAGLVERHKELGFLKTTDLWYTEFKTDPSVAALPVQNLHGGSAKSALESADDSAKSAPLNKEDNKEDKEKKAKAKKCVFEDLVKEQLSNLEPEQVDRWERFQKWCRQQGFENLPKLKQQLTPNQLMEILKAYSAADIKDTLLDMENWSKITTKVSVGLTLKSWLKRSMERKAV